MINLFSDVLFDIEYKCIIDDKYERLYLYADNECVDSFTRVSVISNYFRIKHYNLRNYNEFDLEKAEYVWSIKKFIQRNIPNDFEIKRKMFKVLDEVSYMFSCLTYNYKDIGNFSFSGNDLKLYMLLEQKKELTRKFHTYTKTRWEHFDEVLCWNIEYKLNKMCKKLEEQGIENNSFIFGTMTITKKEII